MGLQKVIFLWLTLQAKKDAFLAFVINISIQMSSWLAVYPQTFLFVMRLVCNLNHSLGLQWNRIPINLPSWSTNFLVIFWESVWNFFTGEFYLAEFHMLQVWLTTQCSNDQKISNAIEKDQFVATQEFAAGCKIFPNHCSFSMYVLVQNIWFSAENTIYSLKITFFAYFLRVHHALSLYWNPTEHHCSNQYIYSPEEFSWNQLQRPWLWLIS